MEDEEKVGDELAAFEQLRSAMGSVALRMRIVYKKRLFFPNELGNLHNLDKASLDLFYSQAGISSMPSAILFSCFVLCNSPLLYCVCRVRRTFVQGVFPQIMRFTATGLNFFFCSSLANTIQSTFTGCSEIGRFKGPS